jgi:hypothetical protein
MHELFNHKEVDILAGTCGDQALVLQVPEIGYQLNPKLIPKNEV